MTLRVVQDGIGAGADTDQVALALLSTKLGITFFVWPIFYAGIAMAAFGMARLLTAGGYRAISSITALLAAITACSSCWSNTSRRTTSGRPSA